MPGIVSAQEAVGCITPGAKVLALTGTSEPTELFNALLGDRERLGRIEFISGFSLGECSFLEEEYRDFIGYTTWQINPRVMHMTKGGNVTFITLPFSRIHDAISPGGPLSPDVFLVQTSPPDKRGNLSLGSSVGYALGAALNSPKVIAQINPRVPRTCGRTTIPASRVDCMIEADTPIFGLEAREPGETERKIAEFVSDLIPDGATVELGIGGIPDAVYRALHDRRDLGIHSGMVSDGIIGLVESGAVTNLKKTIDTGRIVIAEAVGTERLYEYIDENPLFQMHPYEYTHNQGTLSRIANLCAVNSAIEVDLSGQVNAEFLAGIQIGFGGLLDFAVGAYCSTGGRSIIALPSTRRKGMVSTIVSRFSEGVPVTLSKGLVDYVVTEYGAAHLEGKDAGAKAEALIGIAHPDHRNTLSSGMSDMFNTKQGR